MSEQREECEIGWLAGSGVGSDGVISRLRVPGANGGRAGTAPFQVVLVSPFTPESLAQEACVGPATAVHAGRAVQPG